jgi:peptidoglycan hydrolase-like protein with peptidoglycan-binding domain
VISYGVSGKDVKELADYLIRYGYLKKDDIGVIGSGDITFNLKMEDAIKRFQKECGLVVDGKTGTTTIDYIKISQPDSYIDLGDRVLKSGIRGTDVTQLINILIDKEYLRGSLLKGSSLFDESVRTEVVAFQKATRIDADGIVNTQTVYFLKK